MFVSFSPTGAGPGSPSQHHHKKSSSSSSSAAATAESRREAEKRSLDKLKLELSELVTVPGGKRPRMDSPRGMSASARCAKKIFPSSSLINLFLPSLTLKESVEKRKIDCGLTFFL